MKNQKTNYFIFMLPFYFIFLGVIIFVTRDNSLDLFEKTLFLSFCFIIGSVFISFFFMKNKNNIEKYLINPNPKIILEIIFMKRKKDRK